MKTINKKVVKEVEVTKYAAADGKEFDFKKECLDYESENLNKIIRDILSNGVKLHSLEDSIRRTLSSLTKHPEYDHLVYKVNEEASVWGLGKKGSILLIEKDDDGIILQNITGIANAAKELEKTLTIK
jgi:hypothetical protein